MHLTDALGSLRHRDFRWFFLASSVNRLGRLAQVKLGENRHVSVRSY